MKLLLRFSQAKNKCYTTGTAYSCGREFASFRQRVNVEWDEQAVDQVVCHHFIETFDIEAEDIIQVMEMIQMLRNQISKSPTTVVTEKRHRREYKKAEVSACSQSKKVFDEI